jgi:hypothetical protein
MCGRLLARLLANRSADDAITFVAFRLVDPPGPVVACSTPGQFRCYTCSGVGIVDDVDRFSTYTGPGSDSMEEPPARRHRGRPARPFLATQRRTPLELALAQL